MALSEHWSEAAESDYTAAATYLRLLMIPGRANQAANALRGAPTVEYRANDLLRASGLPLLAEDDPEVAKDLKKVRKGKPLAPVLLLRGELGQRPLAIADGYHRICASYHLDEDADIPCLIADPPD
ncbi:MAG TPA: hypothetical protein VHT75_12740 [Acidimicrobiales bacterium]|jgi:hypothetical protein|nr:hypothetical protein [Acidimicrobiales bacterium]